MSSMTQAATAYFQRVAGAWDTLRAGYFSEVVREAAIAHGYLRPEMVVADVGAGTGFIAAGLAPLVSQVYVVDGSPAMLQVAQRNLAGFANIVYEPSEGHVLPLPDASVDAVFANMYLHHCPDPLAAIQEMARVLKPGGRLVLTDMDVHTHAWMRAEMADEWLGFPRLQVKAWLRAAGLVNVMVTCTDQCCAESQADPAQQAQIDVFLATGTRRVIGAQAAVQANYGALAQGGGCCAPAAGSQGSASGFVADIALASSCCAPAAGSQGSASGFVADIALASSCCAPAAGSQGAANGFVADIALTGSCCAAANAMPQVAAGQEIVWDTDYTAEQLTAVPSQAAEISLGCGNPGALASLQPGEVVLDIGSGGGIDAFYAAQRVGPEGRVIGVDMTPAMIERAQKTATGMGLTNVEFRLGQAEALPAADGTVDVVMSNCVINLCEDKGLVFEEIFRTLKPGGRLAISDMVTDGPLPLALRGDPGAWAGCVSGALPEREYLALVAAAGFTDVQAARSRSGGRMGDVAVYSLSVTAGKSA